MKGKPTMVKKTGKVAENPFDRFANARKKHDVVNRKVKGEDRNVGKSREKVVTVYVILLMMFV